MNIKYILVLGFTINCLVQTVAFRTTAADEVKDNIAIQNFVARSNRNTRRDIELTTTQLLHLLGDKYKNYVGFYKGFNHVPDDHLDCVNIELFGLIVRFICVQKNTTVAEFLTDQLAIDSAIKRFNSKPGHTGLLTTMELSSMLNCDSNVANYMRERTYTPDDLNQVNDDQFGDMVKFICIQRSVSVEVFLGAIQ
ncbi:uncharacterized protein LOC126844085 [Adelges cooleyi]|uniref:uncharacterized protein LOC126844085 n=1 Tax=Adelges cooleyi TaxID=133065 RepID=UPI00217FA3D6|nr:uncharacterized protein LOC126844085 [Adelges cooleyi]